MDSAPSRFVTPDNQPWAEAARAHRLLIKHCNECGRNHYYPRPHCPFCGSLDTCFIEASGKASIYTFTINRVVPGLLINAYVTLAEGPVIMTKIVDSDPELLAIGAMVDLAFEDSKMGFPIPVFKLSRSQVP